MFAIAFALQGMFRAFRSTSAKPAPKLVKTWPDQHPDAPLSAFAKSLESI
jgi:hypothetical protein